MKKYKLLDTDTKMFLGRTLFRIQALTSFGNVEEGDLGGYIEREENLAHEGNAWIYDDAYVCGNAYVYDNARVCNNARVFGDARVFHNAWIYDNAQICGNARIYGDAQIYDAACISGNAQIYDAACISGNAYICKNAQIYNDARVFGSAWVSGDAWISNDADVLCISGIGSAYPYITVYMTRNRKIFVECGHLSGTLSEFEEKVKKTCGDSKQAREYQLFTELVKLHFSIKEEK